MALLLALLVTGFAVALWTIAGLRRQVRALAALGSHDILTGLPNRRGLAEGWAALGGDKALLLIDLVGFKSVNDKYGHVVGDDLLRQVAVRLRGIIQPDGVLARWGGDEFVAVVPAGQLGSQCRAIVDAPCDAFPLTDQRGGLHAIYIGARFGTAVGFATLDDAIRVAAGDLMTAKMKGEYEIPPGKRLSRLDAIDEGTDGGDG